MVIRWRIRELAEARGMNMTDLSRAALMAYSSVSMYWHDRARRVDLPVMERLCQALQCQPGDLFKVDENPTRATIDTDRVGLAATHARPTLVSP